MSDRQPNTVVIEDFLRLRDIGDLSDSDTMMVIGVLIDYATDTDDDAVNDRALEFADKLETRKLADSDAVLLNYFRANAWSNRQHTCHRANGNAWSWVQPEMEKQILYLRRALTSSGFDELEPRRRCEILTNLANLFSTLGRFVEAHATWTQALANDPCFWMARGNRGSGLLSYAKALYDEGHRAVFCLFAYRDLTQAIENIERYPHLGDTAVRDHFLKRRGIIERSITPEDVEKSYRPDCHTLGAGRAERAYRQWCLQKVLFLNPLNDVDPESVAANDILTLPDFTTAIGEPPVLIGFFNQLKQEYVSARWHFYEATMSSDPHFSDRDVLLFNTLDYPSYGLAVETMKLAFRAAYSIFDKIAYFLNAYMKIGLPEKRVDFRSIWRENEKAPVRPIFDASENWPFRGLYWLSRDLFDDKIHEPAEPDARKLNLIRNHLEHKYLKVHEMLVRSPETDASSYDLFVDTLAHSISRTDFEKKTLKLLKLSRAALIYLSLGMHHEERRRKKLLGSAMVAPMFLPPLDDEWKR